MERLTIQEEEVMLYIWELNECVVKDIVTRFPEPQPPYTTVYGCHRRQWQCSQTPSDGTDHCGK